MSVTSLFNVTSNFIEDALTARAQGLPPAPCAPRPPSKPKREPPFSLRLSGDERKRLIAEAGGAPLGSYIKAKVLGAPLAFRRSGLAIEDRRALAQVLALLGGVRLSSHLSQMASLAQAGALPLDAATMKAKPLPFFKQKLMGIARELYLEQGWKMPRGLEAPEASTYRATR